MLYQRIFVPIDNSTPSDLALSEAIRLAKSLSATLIIAHSIDTPTYGRGNPEILDSAALEQPLLESGNSLLEAAKARVQAAGVASETLLLQNRGDPIAQVLLTAANNVAADVIIMGTHGRSGIMHLLLGSVAEGVLRQADLPILLVRGD
ncbi:universal stress protein [Paludibacterium purpuratum]|uniref:Nucleotide-binding universal stress UspA family protein n=1 Tax=Paludibacterium purpuratum TaxID=1144873 RepID=A0A4R7BD49_9NEIS|nr:universal stress protein [Paludibacterium purpuratum]TDR82633.1 nucleotide-binding universal stress UspA family protein [Paludibacterium purpuratum]